MTKDPNSLEGRIAWITGSGRGMGRAHAELLASRGADIVIHDVLREEAEETAAAIRATGRRAMVFNDDVTDACAMRALVSRVEAQLGPIDILVNNAGIGEHAEIEEITPQMFQRMFDIHVRGTFFCTQAVVGRMKERRFGRIVNISSIWGMNGHHTASHYCAAKTAVLGLTKAWAKELAGFNILVNAVCPGGVLTEMPIRVQGMEKIRAKEKLVPVGRWATPEEISYAVAYFVAPTGNFVTGQAISPNGGETIVGF
ncbi:SDR family NAD(P)-dependent oxidoreductase [Chelativorans sp. Marseille-P2723]|uniref:SDR family NAD(P)-dependent oxidoreductase n=1 Tax=Chelativorans sp. Marseille-P2723 TaxID=2709133 RepID=UPI00156EF091|nr:SDR family NAD(P)-dependent oxidoreductase [Chelativorans sp. Marseille-P2723]